jgi:hypothetical protein
LYFLTFSIFGGTTSSQRKSSNINALRDFIFYKGMELVMDYVTNKISNKYNKYLKI